MALLGLHCVSEVIHGESLWMMCKHDAFSAHSVQGMMKLCTMLFDLLNNRKSVFIIGAYL